MRVELWRSSTVDGCEMVKKRGKRSRCMKEEHKIGEKGDTRDRGGKRDRRESERGKEGAMHQNLKHEYLE